jgi:hypothetical protein
MVVETKLLEVSLRKKGLQSYNIITLNPFMSACAMTKFPNLYSQQSTMIFQANPKDTKVSQFL